MKKVVPSFNFSLKELKSYAKKGRLEEWVIAFLDGPGINKPMAKGLQLRIEEGYHSWIGPINFPLKKWNTRVDSMVQGIKKGWEVPVLVVNPRAWPTLSIRDGNHRHEALIRSGKMTF